MFVLYHPSDFISSDFILYLKTSLYQKVMFLNVIADYLILEKYFFVSDTITPLNTNIAIKLGSAINALKISAIIQTADTVINGPIKTARIYSHR